MVMSADLFSRITLKRILFNYKEFTYYRNNQRSRVASWELIYEAEVIKWLSPEAKPRADNQSTTEAE